ncbi:MAG: peptidoglycan DD-metalloendopeptidase family protein [Anaerolineae bacterium]
MPDNPQLVGSIRLPFELGPWRSPYAREWQAAYDDAIYTLQRAGVPIYGVLEAQMAHGPIGSAPWRAQFANHAAAVVARYASVVSAFEVLPAPNRPGPDGGPLVPASLFARTLGQVYAQVKNAAGRRDVVLVAGAVVLACDGARYIAQLVGRGPSLQSWRLVHSALGASLPFDAVAIWPTLNDGSSVTAASRVNDEVGSTLDSLRRLTGGVDKPLFISGIYWAASGDPQDPAATVHAAVIDPLAQRTDVRLAIHTPAFLGPICDLRPGAPAPVTGEPALFTFPPQPAHGVDTPPVADRFDFPVGPRGLPEPPPDFHIAVGVADPAYHADPRFQGAWHTGEDWNGPGACDEDLGQPVYAAANGIVTASGYYVPSWGRIVLLEHTLPGGAKVWTQYAHLKERLVNQGDIVTRGQQIGSMGKGANDNTFCAHLHFEVRSTDLSPNIWFPYVRDRNWVESNYLVPSQFVRAHHSDRREDEAGVIVTPDGGSQEHGTFTRSATPNWFDSAYGWNGASLYTYASTQEEEWAEWVPTLPAPGHYEVQAWVPGYHATTHSARYQVTHDGGQTEVVVNQDNVSDAWVSLGGYQFTPGNARVRLSDNTGEADSARLEVGFDAVRWLPG